MSHPEGHVPPCLPSIGAGSSLYWREGSSRRAGTCRASVPFPRGGAVAIYHCCFPKPLTLLLLFTLFTLLPASPAPRRKCGYGPRGSCAGGAGGGQRASAVAPPSPPPGKDAGTSLPSRCPSSPAPPGTFSPPRQDLSILPAWTSGGEGWRRYPRVPGSPDLAPFSPQPSAPILDIVSCAGVGGQSRGPLAVGGPRGAAAPAGSLPDAVFSSLSLSLSRCLRGRLGREGRMVVLSLVLGLSEQDDFANIPDLQPAGTQPNQPNAQGDKRYERGRGQSRRRRRRGPHPGWRRRRRRRLAS